MQAKAAKDLARLQQEQNAAGFRRSGLSRKVVKCQNCGANHFESGPCEYCGPRPSVPVVRRRLTDTK